LRIKDRRAEGELSITIAHTSPLAWGLLEVGTSKIFGVGDLPLFCLQTSSVKPSLNAASQRERHWRSSSGLAARGDMRTPPI
jgi:hypothetical protein